MSKLYGNLEVVGSTTVGVDLNVLGTISGGTIVSAEKWTTSRLLAGNSVDGSANVSFANKFIVQGTADSGLSGSQFLGSLATGLVKNTTTTGVLSIATSGTDYSAGTSALSTGILKSTTTTGALTIAVASDFPTLNQNTTGSAATATTATNATNVATTSTTTNATFYPLFVASSTNSNQAASLDTTFNYNPNSKNLTIVSLFNSISPSSTDRVGFRCFNSNGVTEWFTGIAPNDHIYKIQTLVSGAYGNVCDFDNNGNMQIYGANAYKSSGSTWLNPSDIRIKKNIEDFSDGLETILNLRPVTFEFNELAGSSFTGKSIGFIAQEVEKYAPYMVTQIDDVLNTGIIDKRIMDESALTKLLVNAIKELSAKIDDLEFKLIGYKKE